MKKEKVFFTRFQINVTTYVNNKSNFPPSFFFLQCAKKIIMYSWEIYSGAVGTKYKCVNEYLIPTEFSLLINAFAWYCFKPPVNLVLAVRGDL